jgi:hypothetical protein
MDGTMDQDQNSAPKGAADRERLERAVDAIGLVLVLLLEVFGLVALALVVLPSESALAAGPAPASNPADTSVVVAAPSDTSSKPARIKVKVEVLGVQGALRRNVLASLSIAHKKDRKNASQGELRHLHSRADEEIGRALQPFGYYRPFIHSELTTGKQWVARYQIEPGPPLLVDSVLVEVTGEGAADPKYQRLVQDFPVKKGNVLLHQAYEQGKLSLETYSAEGGYLDAQFDESRIEVDLARYTATVMVRYDSGPKHFFGPVAFDHAVIERGMLERYPTFKSGDVFNFRKLQDLQSNLSNTGYFARVEVEPSEETMGHRQVPIDVSLAPAKKLRFSGGVGYGTDDGARVRAVIEMRRLNSQGHRAQLNTQYGQRDKRAELQYFIPWPNPRTDVATLSTGYLDVTTQTSTSQIEYGGGSLSRLLGKWRVIPALNFRREKFTVGVDHGTVSTLVPEGTWSRRRAPWRGYFPRRRYPSFISRAPICSAASTGHRPSIRAATWTFSSPGRMRLQPATFCSAMGSCSNQGMACCGDFREQHPSRRDPFVWTCTGGFMRPTFRRSRSGVWNRNSGPAHQWVRAA